MTRPPRNPRKDRLVDTKLIFHAYFLVGMFECFLSFTMAFWCTYPKSMLAMLTLSSRHGT